LIIEKGVSKVIIGMLDPNPKVNGKGVHALRAAGVTVETGILEKECRHANRSYIKHMTTGLPEVIVKTAHTLDGRIATVTQDSRWITGITARTFTHSLRAKYSSILVGIGTVIADDPMLTVRHVKGPNPLRIALDSKLRTPISSKIIREQEKTPTIIFTTDAAKEEDIENIHMNTGAKIVIAPINEEEGGIDLHFVLKHLGDAGIDSLLVEGGAAVFTSFIRDKLVDRKLAMIAPKIIGADGIPLIGELGVSVMAEVENWRFNEVRLIGDDVLLDLIIKEY
jgi:diaminohydroxyphosphoribosylaminopyrimidine deaminase/5-amino-6-(5-phosphoribosylamino)uracil reductase